MASKLIIVSILAVLIIFYLFFYSNLFGFEDIFEIKVLVFILIVLVIAFGIYLAKILKEPVMLTMR